jgi:hypothetical protein
MVTSAQYEGRTIDIQAWATPEGMISPQSSGNIVTGIIKLSERFLITLLNEEGSIKYDYHLANITRGTQFMTRLREGGVQTEADLRALFALSEIQAKAQLVAQETGDEPDDERYKTSRIVSVEIGQGNISLTITLESQSDSVELILPLPIVV